VRRRLLALSVVSLLLFGSAACGGDSGKPSSSASVDMGDTITGLKVSGDIGTAPKVSVSKPITVDKPVIQVIKAGTGAPVQTGQEALLHIYIAKGKDGSKAATTYDQSAGGQPLDVHMDESQLFKQVVDALVGKPQGSRVAIAAPVKAIYGARGASQIGLKASDTAIFVVDVMSVTPKTVLNGPTGASHDVPAGLPTVKSSGAKVTGLDFAKAAKKPGTKLQVIPLRDGTGPKVRAQSLVTFNYFGEVYGGTKPFDESFSKQPVTFALGMHKLIQGWDKGLVGLKAGSRVMLVVPPGEGYGSAAQQNIPANSTLVFVVDILGVDNS